MRKVFISVAMGAGTWCILAWTVNLLFATVLMIGLIIHESGHLIAMYRNGISIKGLYFLPFVGAVIVPKDRLPDRWTGVKVTLAGPALGSCSAILALAAWYVWREPAIAGAAYFFAVINAFNMIPVFPLDGGQALAYALDDGKRTHQAIYKQMWLLYLICISLLFGLSMNWLMAFIVAYIGYGGIRGFLTEIARRQDRARVVEALAETFETTPELVCDAVEAPLARLMSDEAPGFPPKLLAGHLDLTDAYGLYQIEWSVRGSEELPSPETGELSEIGAEIAELEADLTEREANLSVERLLFQLKMAVRLRYAKAVCDEAEAACASYPLAPFQKSRVTPSSVFDPRKFGEGYSDIRTYLGGPEPAPISAPLALRGRLLFLALAVGLGALTYLSGTIAGWSFKALL